MSHQASQGTPWAPPADDQLTWFLVEDRLIPALLPLDYTVEVHAIVFGLTRAFEGQEFPVYAVRSRLVDGRLYLAMVPSETAERDLPRRMRNMRDLSLRFTGNVRRSCESQIQPRVEGYNRWIAELASLSGSRDELSERVLQLRRVRGNQWYTTIQGVVAATALIQRRLEDTVTQVVNHGARDTVRQMIRGSMEPNWDEVMAAVEERGYDSGEVRSLVRASEDAMAVTQEALAIVRDRGRKILHTTLQAVGERLVKAGCIEMAGDIFWLEWLEVRHALQSGGSYQALVAQRQNEASGSRTVSPHAIIGPPLPADRAENVIWFLEIMELLG